MKQPRIEDFDPDASKHQLGSPMDDMPAIIKPGNSAGARELKSRKSPDQKSVISEAQVAKQKSSVEGTPKGAATLPDGDEKIEKYTTHVEPSLKKKVQLFAIENEMNDYDVVRAAIREYLAKHK